jgi:hypothetical protein
MEVACARLMPTQENVTEKQSNISHDVFISYAHKNPNEGHLLLEEFQKQYPNLEVFFDRQDLQVGMVKIKSILVFLYCVIIGVNI